MHRSGQGISFQIQHTQEPLTTIARRKSVTAIVGGVPVGSSHPIVVQSMTNTDTGDASGTALQVAELARAGSRKLPSAGRLASVVPTLRVLALVKRAIPSSR